MPPQYDIPTGGDARDCRLSRVAQMISRDNVGHGLRLVREIVWVAQPQEVFWNGRSSCAFGTPTFFRKRVLKWRVNRGKTSRPPGLI